MDKETKDQIFGQVYNVVDMDVGGLALLRTGVCVPMNFTAHDILKGYGIETAIKAGSFAYPYEITEEGPNNAIQYRWDSSDIDMMELEISGVMPEVHTWLEDITTKEIIDMSTFKLVTHLNTLGSEWLADVPPQYIWGDIGPAVYKEDQTANEFIKVVRNLWLGG